MEARCVIAVVVACALCQYSQCQEPREFEGLVDASPVGPGWMQPSEFPSFLEWIDKERALSADAVRQSNLLATAAFVRHCNNEEDVAKKLLEEAIARSSATRDRNLIIAARILGTAEAVSQLDTIATGSQWHVDAVLQKAEYYNDKGQYAESIKTLDEVTGEHTFEHYLRGVAFLYLGSSKKAQAELGQYLETSDCGPMERMSSAIVFYATTQMMLREHEEAVRTCERGLQIYPKDKSLRYIMSRQFCELDRVQEAFELAKGLENEFPGSPQASAAMGVSLYRLYDFKKSILYLQRSHELVPNESEIAQYLTGALMFCQRNEEAASVAKHFLKLTGSSKDIKIRETMKFLQAINECYFDDLTAVRKESLRDILRDGIENTRANHFCRVFACSGLYKIGEPQLAKELFIRTCPGVDFGAVIAEVERNGTLVIIDPSR